MDINHKRIMLASAIISVVLASTVIIAAVSYFPASFGVRTTSARGSTTSLMSGDSTSSTSSGLGMAPDFSISAANCKSNCTVSVPWTSVYHQYPNLTNLVTDSQVVLLANVTSETTVLANGIPVTSYNITAINDVLHNTLLKPGQEVRFAQVGGTAEGITMSIKGYPLLSIDGTYVFFLYSTGGKVSQLNQGSGVAPPSRSTTVINGTTITYQSNATGTYSVSPNDPLAQYILPIDNGHTFIAVGGPQGVFSVHGGQVYSLDHLYSQDDAWLPLKVSGVPLAQFMQEVQSAATTSPVSSSTSTIKG